MEVGLVKNLMHNLPEFNRLFPGEEATWSRIGNRLVERDREAQAASAAAVTPVRHTIKIEAVN